MSDQRLASLVRFPTSRKESVLHTAALSLSMRRSNPVYFIAFFFLPLDIFFKPAFQPLSFWPRSLRPFTALSEREDAAARDA